MPAAVLSPPFQSMNAAAPNMFVYMVKLEGRYEVEAWNMPGLKTMAMRKNIAILGFKVLAIVENRRVSQQAHMKPRTRRRK